MRMTANCPGFNLYDVTLPDGTTVRYPGDNQPNAAHNAGFVYAQAKGIRHGDVDMDYTAAVFVSKNPAAVEWERLSDLPSGKATSADIIAADRTSWRNVVVG